MYYKTMCESSIGNMMLASDGIHLVGLWIEGQKHFADSISEEIIEGSSIWNSHYIWRYLTGYAGGIDKKIKLLQHEGVKL